MVLFSRLSATTNLIILWSVINNIGNTFAYGIYQNYGNDTEDESAGNDVCPYMRLLKGTEINEDSCVVGPPCTMGVHWNYTECDPTCPVDSAQPSENGPFISGTTYHDDHTYADQFMMDFIVYFVKAFDDPPPYYNLTRILEDPANTIGYGRTFYDINYGGGFMRESYYERCLPIFPKLPLNETNEYSCDFYTLNDNNTAYTVFHDDRPTGAPECCIIANPFRCPPQNFWENLPHQYQIYSEETVVDMRSVYLPFPMLNVTYGFYNDYYSYVNENDTTEMTDISVPWVFYFTGLPWLYSWNYQRFYNFTPEAPDVSDVVLPESCLEESVTWCPGWEPATVANLCGVEDEDDDSGSLELWHFGGMYLFVQMLVAGLSLHKCFW